MVLSFSVHNLARENFSMLSLVTTPCSIRLPVLALRS